MRTNGTIQLGKSSGTVRNEYGEVTGSIVMFGEPIPCSIRTNSDTRKGVYADGEYRRSSYLILIELQNVTDVTRVRLERLGESLGDFDVLSSEPLDTVGRTQIMV